MIPTKQLLTFCTILIVCVMMGGCSTSQTMTFWNPTPGTDSSSRYFHASRASCLALAQQGVPEYQGTVSRNKPPTYTCNSFYGSATCRPNATMDLSPVIALMIAASADAKRNSAFASCMIGKGFYQKFDTYDDVSKGGSNGTQVPHLGKRHDRWYQLGQDTPYTGIVKMQFYERTPLGEAGVRMEFHAKDGLDHGPGKIWNGDGTLQCSYVAENGKMIEYQCVNPPSGCFCQEEYEKQ